ncbi:MAG: DUF4340 domain-containing protein [Gloeomargarita sp. SKYG116]|nr:DUF4340 domain-containing protein [Gloeomargarita sp. SKYG116]MCS7293747.1 DUF4340 domain-containing protein [Gloeomargarita sp. SKYB120]MDW8179313.1 DUF4340 domain-containing protein [Gloeomargarita sp. SKYBB_i_bin120]MDW8402264.1 DUF4340 domain-containing protein [Gloeomargarita sp. SKYGB_i_bin116]
MKLSTSTLIILALAIGLAGGVAYWEWVGKPQRQEQATRKARLFNFTEKDVTAITIIKPKETLKFERVKPGEWKMVQPQQKPANTAPIAFLLGQMTTAERVQDQDLTIKPEEKAQFGLTTPLAMIQVTLENGNQHRLILGNPDFTGVALYAQIDPPTEATSLSVALVPIDLRNAVDRPLGEWQASPKPEKKPETKSSPKP